MLRDKGEDSRRKRIQQSRKHEIRVVLEPEEISARSDRVSKMELQRAQAKSLVSVLQRMFAMALMVQILRFAL